MLKKLLKIIVLILMLIGIYFGVSITLKRYIPSKKSKNAEINVMNMIQTRPAELTGFYTYGKGFNVRGKITNIDKDNFENARLVLTDGIEYEKNCNLDCSFEENDLYFDSSNINSGIVLDDLENKEYYLCLRLKLNNSVNPKFYSFSNISEYGDLNYYTVTSDGQNRMSKISFKENNYNSKKYNLLSIKLEQGQLPDDVYDIVIDAGNGGKDPGEVSGSIKEADVNLQYAKLLKQSLEEKGYKVKLTRDDENTSTYTYTNMYDSDGRISIACRSKAKLMISFQINNGDKLLKGFEIYGPCKSDMSFAEEMAKKIKENTSIEYSNNSTFKVAEGVYVRNYTAKDIKEAEIAAKRKKYEPYNINEKTPFFYTIREVGGIGAFAYVDGRNTAYSANEYYKSNQGIECYEVDLGYIKNDLDIIRNEKEGYIKAITEAIETHY